MMKKWFGNCRIIYILVLYIYLYLFIYSRGYEYIDRYSRSNIRGVTWRHLEVIAQLLCFSGSILALVVVSWPRGGATRSAELGIPASATNIYE